MENPSMKSSLMEASGGAEAHHGSPRRPFPAHLARQFRGMGVLLPGLPVGRGLHKKNRADEKP